jgi:phage/plasmid-like protein (TIGR03299 family)
MSHDIQVIKDKASFAFNQNHGDPWHQLGTAVEGNMTIDEAMRLANIDFIVKKRPIFASTSDDDSSNIEIDNKVATVAFYENGMVSNLGVVGKTYEVVQNRASLEVAYDIVGASKGDAYLDTVGALGNGGQLFAYLRLEDLIIDPVGINDQIENGLVISWSHDGTIAMTYLFSNIRVVCRNTLNMAVSGAKNVFRAKHTSSVDDRLKQAQQVLGVSTKWADSFKEESEKLLKVSYSEDRFQRVLNKVFPEPNQSTERQKRNTQAVHTQIRGIFSNERNSKNFGSNGWTMYNAMVEYLDHARDASVDDRLKATMTVGSWVEKKKVQAANTVLALA